MRIHANPTHAIQVIRPRVLILENRNPTIPATARKTAVHAPCAETALSPIDRLSIPDPATKIQYTRSQNDMHKAFKEGREGRHTETKDSPKNLTTNRTKHQRTSIIDPVDFSMAEFENTHDVVRPSAHDSNGTETETPRDYA